MPNPRHGRRAATTALTLFAACTATPHPAGSSAVEARVHYSVPVLQRALFWDGNGEVDNAGASLFATHYVADGVGLGAGATVAEWFLSGEDAYSGEISMLGRWYPVTGLSGFWQSTCGFQQASDNIPPGGTEWNFTFSFGPGIEVPVAEHESLLLGVDFHHTSNALGRQSHRNPSQNEGRLWIGYSWTF
ncbi:MAG: hypothetical protein U1E73_01175 [Planctomycetota bacterium]